MPTIKICKNGHKFEKSSSCPVCPICSQQEMSQKFGQEFSKIGAPALRALASIGVTHLSELKKFTEEELLQLHGFGPKALKLLKDRMNEQGISFVKE